MAKRTGPPENDPEDEKKKKPPARKPPPPPSPSPDDSGDELSESTALVFMSESDVQRLDSDEALAPSSDELLPAKPLGDSHTEPPHADLTESTSLVILSESDVVRLESDEEVPTATPLAGPPGGPSKKGPAAPPKRPGVGVAGARAGSAGKGAGPPSGGKPGSPPRAADDGKRGSRLIGIVLGVLIAILASAVTGYAVHRAAEEHEAALEDDHRKSLAAGQEESERHEQDLRAASDASIRAKDREIATLRRQLDEERQRAVDRESAIAADRARRDEEARRQEQALRDSFQAERATLLADAVAKERARADRERLDLERRARDAVARYDALLAEAGKKGDADAELARREARAEILRREAMLKKKFEQEKAALAREKESALQSQALQVEARIRAEVGAGSGDREGLVRGPRGGGGLDEQGIDLERIVWDHLTGHLGGSLEYRLKAHFQLDPDSPDGNRIRDEGIAKLRYEASLAEDHVAVKVVPRVRADDDRLSYSTQHDGEDERSRRPVFTFEEALISGHFGSFDVALGKQIFAWGAADILNPTDRMNPVDFTDLLDSEKIGILAADMSIYPQEETRLRLVLVPTFTPARFALPGERFSLSAKAGVFLPVPSLGVVGPLFVGARDLPQEGSVESVQACLRASTSAFGWDVAAMYYCGLNPLPSVVVRQLAAPPFLTLTPEYDRIHVLGFDFATTFKPPRLGDVQVHGEFAQTITEGGRDDDYLQCVVGGDKTFADPLLGKEATLVLEYAGEWRNQDRTRQDVIPAGRFARIFTNAVLARLTWKPAERLELLTTAALLVESPQTVYVRPEARFEIGQHTKIVTGLDVLQGSRNGFFGALHDDTRFFLNLKLSF